MKTNLKKLTLTALFVAIAVVGSIWVNIPVFGSKCAPVQHLVNIICAIFLGPGYGLIAAFAASLIRNLLGVGSLLAFPGSMCGALLAGLLYKFGKKRWLAYVGEVFGTAVLGGMLSYPIAHFLMNNAAAAIFTFVFPFFVSTAGGTLCAIIIVETMAKSGVLTRLKGQLEEADNGTVYNSNGCSKEGNSN